MKCLIEFVAAIVRKEVLMIEKFDFNVYRMTWENVHKIILLNEIKQCTKLHTV